MRPGEPLSLTVTLPNEQRIEVPEVVVRWSRGQEFAVEAVAIELHTHARLVHYVKRLVWSRWAGSLRWRNRSHGKRRIGVRQPRR